MLFLGIESICVDVYRYLDLFPSADVGKHIFEKYFQVCEKAKQNTNILKKIRHGKDNNSFHVWRQQTGIKYKGIILSWTRELLLQQILTLSQSRELLGWKLPTPQTPVYRGDIWSGV